MLPGVAWTGGGNVSKPRAVTLTSWGIQLFRVRGVPVLLSPSWWLGSFIIVVLYAPLVDTVLAGAGTVLSWAVATAFAVLLGASVLAHELGHTVVALRMGLPVRRVRLFLLGGLSEIARMPRNARQEGVIAVAGPAVSLALAAGFIAVLIVFTPAGATWLLLAQCAVANLVVGVFNLLPGLPLDGGRIVRAGVWRLAGTRTAGTYAAAIGGMVVAAALLVWALHGLAEGSQDRWLRLAVCLLVGWFILSGARAEMAAERRRLWPAGLGLGEIMQPVLQLPAESPVADALSVGAGRGVVLVRVDGTAAGLLDVRAARQLAVTSPSAPAERAAEPVRPESVLLASEQGNEIAERVLETAAWQFLIVDDDGHPTGVLRREDLQAAISRGR